MFVYNGQDDCAVFIAVGVGLHVDVVLLVGQLVGGDAELSLHLEVDGDCGDEEEAKPGNYMSH